MNVMGVSSERSALIDFQNQGPKPLRNDLILACSDLISGALSEKEFKQAIETLIIYTLCHYHVF